MNNDPEDRIKTHHGHQAIWIWCVYGAYLTYIGEIHFLSLSFFIYFLITFLIPIASAISYLLANIISKLFNRIFDSSNNEKMFPGIIFAIIDLGIYLIFNIAWTIFLARLLIGVI